MNKKLSGLLKLLLITILLAAPSLSTAAVRAAEPASEIAAMFDGLRPADPALAQDFDDCLHFIARQDPEGADVCDQNQQLISWLQGADPDAAAAFVSFVSGIKEMKTNLFAYAAYGSRGGSALRDFLTGRIESSPYATMGFGPNPENFLRWAFKFKSECPECPNVAATAVLPWEMLSMRTKKIVADVIAKRSKKNKVPDLEAAKAKWSALLLAQRTRLLAEYVNPLADKFIKGNCTNSPAEEADVFPYLDFSGSAMSKIVTYQERCDMLDGIAQNKNRTKVPAAVQARYGNLPLGRRLQELSDYLARTGKDDTLISKQINEIRRPIPMSQQDRQTLAALLAPRLLAQIKTTEVGKEVAGYFDRGELKLKFAIEKQDGSNAYFSPTSKTIAVSSALMSRYMRTHGYTMRDMLNSKRAREGFAMFISPTFLHEAIHQVQNDWAVSHGYPDMYVKSKEEETFATQSVYMEQRMRSDPSFRRMVELSKKYSEFIATKDSLKDDFMSNPTGLKSTVDYGYYTSVPNTDGGRADYAMMLVGELSDRARLSEAEQARLETEGVDYQTAMEQYAETREGPFRHMKTSLLEDMRDNLVTQMQVFREKEAQVWDGIMSRRDALLSEGGK